jgi:hypothetical protein
MFQNFLYVHIVFCLYFEGVLSLPAGDLDPLVLSIIDTNFTEVESRGDFAALIQTGVAKVNYMIIQFFFFFC